MTGQPVPGADHRVLVTGTGHSARQAARVLAVGLAAGLLLGATPLHQWTESLPEGWGWAGRAAAGWEAAMGQAGLNRPYATIRGWVRAAEAP